ncbi:LamG-like jellyroll fold domain-containing protein [Microbispora sp. H10670]|uniref:LamG-like jellyroll fold domain-containing protein n=1 Tax=Microbispora sp. H10670 TaxID=2729108 RepID=UPI0015FEEBAB|nr:LamG-like jellyroll fold domain-containing protein [Microbispora sp. H10670]
MAALVLAVLATGLPATAEDASQASGAVPQPVPPPLTQFPKPRDADAPLREAIAEAKKQGKPVPVPSKDTETSWTWAYPDSHLTTETWAGPARVKQPDGTFRWVDTTLEERDGALYPKVAKVGVRIGNGGDTHLATLERAEKGQSFAVDWPARLPKPRIEGNKAIYDISTSDLKADLVVTALATGFRHDVVLRERPTGPVEFRLPVRSEGLKLSETKAGGLKLTDAKGKVVASAAEPFMMEAPSTDAKSAPNMRGQIDTRVVGKAGDQTLVIKPDPKFLADKDTTYPVTVDPTVSLTATMDAWIQSRTGAADATDSVLNVGTGTYYQSERRCSGSVCSYTNKIYPNFLRGYVGFGDDASGFAGKYVESATLQLLGSYAGSCVGRTLTASPVTSSWDTDSLSWNLRPSTTSTGAVTITPSCGSDTVTSLNVTQMARNWSAGGGFYGVELKSTEDTRSSWPDESNPISAQYWSFYSVESGQSPPKLSVNYLLPPEIPTVTGESIDSIAGTDAISRTSDVKVNYSSTSIDGKKLDYLVSISDPTTPIPVPTTTPSPSPSPSPTPSPSPAGTAVPGLVAAYGMNEGTGTAVADQSGTGNAGTASGTAWAVGKFGQALSFNGTSSRVNVNNSASLQLTNKMTIEAWVKPSSVSGYRTVIMKEASSDASYALYSSINGGFFPGMGMSGPTSYLQIGGSIASVTGPTALPTNTWSHIASTYDGTVIKTYVNGTVVAQSTVSGNLASSTAPLRIGGNSIYGEYFSGLIDEVRVYNVALTQGQVQSDMNTAVGNTATVDNPPTAPGTLNAVAGPDTVDLSWAAATDDRGTVTYQVHRSTTAGFTPSAATRVATVNGLTYSDSGMVQGQYYYRIVAVDSAGQMGPASNEAAARTSAQLFPPVTGSPSGQVVSNEFQLGSPDSFKFKIKACLSGIPVRICNETPYYRITTDAPFAPSSLSVSLEDPQKPILSGMAARPSGGSVTAKFFLYNNAGLPVGAVPLGVVQVAGGERAELAVPENLLQPGAFYTWKMQACVQAICSSRTEAEGFTVEGTDEATEDAADAVQRVTLRSDAFAIMTGPASATACGGGPCSLTESGTIKVGGSGDDKTVTVLGINVADIPGSSVFTNTVLDLGSPVCAGAPCPANLNLSVRPLDTEVTTDTKGSQVSTLPGGEAQAAPVQAATFTVTGQELSWFAIDSDSAIPVVFGDAAAPVSPTVSVAYIPPGPPGPIVNLKATPGDGGGTVSWGVPETNGSMAMLEGYDVEVLDQSGEVLTTTDTGDPTALVDDLVNGVTYTIRVHARTTVGTGEWVSTSLTPRASRAGSIDYAETIKSFYEAQDAVLEGRVPEVWALPQASPSAPLAARLALLNTQLVSEKQSMDAAGMRRTDSTISLASAVVQATDDTTVLVDARVDRSWKIVSKDDQGQEQVTVRQTSERETFAFQRDDRLSYEMGSVDLQEDSSDLVAGDVLAELEAAETAQESPIRQGDSGRSLQKKSGPSVTADKLASPNSAAASPDSPSGCGGYFDIVRRGSAPILRPVKGAAIQTAVRSRWLKPELCVDSTTWPIYRFSAITKMYTNSSFWSPKKKNSKGKWVIDKTQQQKNKYIYDHSRLDLSSSACFAANTTSFTVGGEVSVEKGGGSFGGGAAVAGQITQSGNEFCQPYEAEGLVAAGIHELSFASGSVVARCWGSGGNTCDIKAYGHSAFPEFRMNYWVSPSQDRQCHPVNPKKLNGCKKMKVLHGRKADTGFLQRNGNRY